MKLFKGKPREPDPDEENSVEGERALTSVNKGLTVQNRIINWTVAACACMLAAFLLYRYYAGMYHEHQQAQATHKDVSHTVATTTLPPLTLPDPEPVKLSSAAVASDTLPPMKPSAAAATAAPTGQPPFKTEAELIQERRLKHDLRFSLDGGAGAAVSDAAHAAVATTATAAGAAATAQAGRTAASRAYMLSDPTLMMTRGKVIPCTVIPAIDTTLTGTVTCVTAEDATGADNKVSLMDRGTFCVGRQGGGVTQGQRRVGIVWQRCETPQHVMVPLEADATDALGRPGIPGDVDNHFWDRFGAAIALSLISDIGPYLVATRQGSGNGNTTIAFPNILNGPQEVMSEVLKNTVDIPPTITAPQAGRVLIFLNGDIDFRDVYQLERTK